MSIAKFMVTVEYDETQTYAQSLAETIKDQVHSNVPFIDSVVVERRSVCCEAAPDEGGCCTNCGNAI